MKYVLPNILVVYMLVLGGFRSQAQAVESRYKTTFETLKYIVSTDDQLKRQILQNQIAGPLTPEELRRRQERLQTISNAIWERQKAFSYVGGVLMTAGDWGPAIKTAANEFKEILPNPIQKKIVGATNSAGKIYDAFPQYAKDFFKDNIFKYTESDYWATERQKKYDELLFLTYPPIIAAAMKENPQNYKVTLGHLADQINDPFIKSSFNEYRLKNEGKPFSSSTNYQQASQKLLDIDTRIANFTTSEADLYGQQLFNEEIQYYIAQLYNKDLGVLQNQASTIQRELRNTNLSQQEILAKQSDLEKVVAKIGISLSGLEFATNKRLGSIEEKLNKYGTITEQLLFEVKFEKTELDKRVIQLESMRLDATSGKPTLLTLQEIDAYLERDRDLQKQEKHREYVEVAEIAIKVGNGALAIMETLDIGSPKFRQYVGYGLKLAEVGLNIFTGSYDKAFAGIMSLFSKPKPSPELQMLIKVLNRLDELERTISQQFLQLHNDLVAVHQDLVSRLDVISYQLDDLRADMMLNHQQVMSSLFEIENRLDYLVQQNLRADAKLTALLGGSQDACFEPYYFWKPVHANSDTLKLTTNYINSFIEGLFCRPCFDALLTTLNEDFVEGPKRSAFDYAVEPAEAQFQSLYNQPDVFRKQVNFWSGLYSSNAARDTAISALMFPTIKVTEHWLPYERLRKLKVAPTLDAFKAFSNVNYINYKRVLQLANYVTEFYSILSIYRNGLAMNASDAVANASFLQFRSQLLENGAKKTLNLVEKSIAHESLIMGIQLFDEFYKILSASKYSPDESSIGPKTLSIGQKIEDIFKLLQSNPILAQNFATFVINKAITNESFESNFKKYDNGIKNFVAFEGFVPNEIAQWFFLNVDKDGISCGIQKQFIKSSGGVNEIKEESVFVPLVKSQEPILVNDILTGIKESYVTDIMLPTEGLMPLLEAREKLQALIIEVNTLKQLTANDTEQNLSVKDLQFLMFNEEMVEKAYNNLIAENEKQFLALVQSLKSGDWNNITTWDCNCIPGQGNDVLIKEGHNIQLTKPMGLQKARSLRFNKGGVLNNNGSLLIFAF